VSGLALNVLSALRSTPAGMTSSVSSGARPASWDVDPERTFTGLDLLAAIPVENEHRGGYNRDLYPTWLDLDGDGCDARQQALRRDSIRPVRAAPGRCQVIAGEWLSPYDGVAFIDLVRVEVDHVVALKEAWDSGAWAWSGEQRIAFANDVTDSRTLRVVSASSNRAKGDADPSNWLPPQQSDWCRYLGDWVAIKARWQLAMDQSEAGRIRNVLKSRCPGFVVAGWVPAPTFPATSATGLSTPVAEPFASVPQAPTTSQLLGDASGQKRSTTVPYYASCAAARAAGATPLHRGQPGYRTNLDGDNDGVACEPLRSK
jgi:hypothetical protein